MAEEKQVIDEKIAKGNVAGIIASLALTPSRETVKSFTYITRMQALFFPQIDTLIAGRKGVLEIASYRQMKARAEASKLSNKELTAFNKMEIPEVPNLANEYLMATAEWQKSISGATLEKAVNLAMAEIESQRNKDDLFGEQEFDED